MSRIVDCFDEACRNYRERCALMEFGRRSARRVSFEDLKRDVDRVCAALHEKGLQRGDRVVLFVSPSYELLVFLIACLKLGASLMIIDLWAGKGLIRQTFREYRADYIAVSGKTKLIRLAFGELRKIKALIRVDKLFANREKAGREGQESAEALTNAPRRPMPEIPEQDVAVLTMTTGSTGRPKIVLRSHRDLYRQLELVRSNMDERKGETIALNTSFMYHFVNILNGYSGILLPAESRALLAMLGKNKRRSTQELPAQVLFSSPDFCLETELRFPALEELYFGGAILNLYEAEKIRKKFPQAKITYIYGATECNLICKTNLDDYIQSLREGRTVLGEAVKGVRIKTDENREIMVHADVVLADYLNPEQRRGEVDEEGRYWHRTGDLGRIEDGTLVYLGRRDVFVRGTQEDFCSNEIEQAVVRRFSGLKKCACFYHRDKNYLFVEGDPCSEGELRDFAKAWGLGEDLVITRLHKIPCDAKHHSKIDYNHLKRLAERRNRV